MNDRRDFFRLVIALSAVALVCGGLGLALGYGYLPTGHHTLLEGASLLLAVGSVAVGIAAFVLAAVSMPPRRRLNQRADRLDELIRRQRAAIAVFTTADGGQSFVLTDINDAAAEFAAVAAADAVGRPLAEALPPAQGERLLPILRRVWKSGEAEHAVPVAIEADGGTAWRDERVFRLADGSVVVASDDVSERYRAEQALKESEERWRSVLDMPAIPIVLVDDRYDIRFVNKAAEAVFAQPSQELLGAPFGFPIVQGDVAEIEIIRPKQGVVYAEMRVVPLKCSGETQYMLFIQDVSAFKRAEGDLRKLFQAIEQSPASVVITDVAGRIEYVNPKFTELTGFTYPEVVGKNPSILKSGYTPRDEYARLWRMITAGHVWHGEFYNRKKNGQLFWELASVAPVRNPAGDITHYVAVKEDITDRKATEDRLRISQRMEVIGQLTGGVAHDFNNLLAIIMGNLQLLEERLVHDREARDLLADAIWSAERGAQLTHGLLAFARRQRLNPKITDVNRVVSEMTDLLRRTLGEKIEIREALQPGLWTTMIDRSQLESALLNLVVNARDAMADGGMVTIATGNVELPIDGGPKAEEAQPGDYIVLSVSDTGVGIPPDVQERIFEPFFTTKKLGEGSGLGLSMVYGFVRQSGGHIVVDSTVGVGTTLRVFLPRAEAALAAADAPRPAARKRRTGGEVILVVEDDARVRKTATNILAGRGYQVLEAGDANEALRLLGSTGHVDLLFTDVVLPNGMNGSQLAREALDRYPDTRVLFTSGYAAEAELASQLPNQPIELLTKPYRQSELTIRVREILDRAGR
ncbi:MAG: PAS domain S-box protein [Rhodospirillales bacterium]|nr:PAS domain S-box protein [Rhodospirillales bacterium]